jgi:FMN phosphatase YigB (HAD superfamily)
MNHRRLLIFDLDATLWDGKSLYPQVAEILMNLIGKSICCAEENDDKKSLPLPTAEEGMLRKKQSCEHRKNAKLEHMRALTL